MASPLRQRTIVIADGDTSFRTFLSGLLRPRQGVRVLEARGAWDVWPLLDAEEIHLFVVDAQVPESGGVALVEQLRERGVRTPVLFIASNWQNHRTHEQLTHELTVQRVMHKPFSAYQFIMEVESTLEAPEATLSRSIPPPKVGSVPRRLVSEPAMPAAEGPAPISSGRGTTTFVVVGTDAELTDGLRAVAEQSLVTLVFAPDAASAITLIRARPVDGALVLLGADDPDLGFAEATELLCTEVGKGLPTGFVSRHTDVHTRVNAIHAGGLVHLTPPFHVQDLQHAVSAMSQARSEEPALVMLVADRRRGAEIGAVLAAANMKVDGVSDAYTLLEHLGAATPDVLLFDLDLPGVSGLDVCKLLRASPTFCALAVVLLGTHDSSEARIAAFDAGADDFLIKPLGEEELLARVEARVPPRGAGVGRQGSGERPVATPRLRRSRPRHARRGPALGVRRGVLPAPAQRRAAPAHGAGAARRRDPRVHRRSPRHRDAARVRPLRALG